jgi:single-strand DNA-binding protein
MGPVNKVLLAGRLTRDPELRQLASGKAVATFGIATNEYRTGQEKSEFHNIVAWDKLAQICAQYLGKGQQVAVDGRLQTRHWDDDQGKRHWRTEIVAGSVEMLSGRKKKDWEAEAAAESLETQAATLGIPPLDGTADDEADGEDEEDEEDAVPASEPIPEAVAA